jgi:hypothetical protein
MKDLLHDHLINKYYCEYKNIGSVPCPALGGEYVYFLKRGFRHLIWKGNKLRERKEQIIRFELIKYAPTILRSSSSFKDYNKNNIADKEVNFWSFTGKVGNDTVIVLVRQIRSGPKHFFSIMKRDR